ncbi:conserved hypothetical protein [uncultured Desulfobacterium sp.]|uniref:FAD-binding PCMH-type domain-containing protein n=1 Tax=uncultured Desulfobacterium sp. TaxID=201089 RepID=A0A445N0Z9_9BACT|nr:conserved hypothetical protein [uncultured Desulfobacterium sp.]
MLRLPKFEYMAPPTLDEAISLLEFQRGGVKILAGGTDLLPCLKDRLLTPAYVMDLRRVGGLTSIEKAPGNEIRIGALCSMTAIEESSLLKKRFAGLTDAASLVGGPAIRNMGTIGGNIAIDTRCWYFNQSHLWRKSIEQCLKLGGAVCHVVKGAKRCHACFVADTVPALISLNADIIVRDSGGERRHLLKEIYTNDGKNPNKLKPHDIITQICIPMPDGASGSAYKKLMLRGAIDFPLVSSAVYVCMDGDAIADVKIVLGAVDSGPIEITEAENLLRGNTVNDDLIRKAGYMAQQAARPVANRGSSPSYRKKMAGVFTRRALKEAIARAKANCV